MEMSTVFAFAAAFFVFAASPGPDNMTIIAHTLSRGAPSGIAYGAGTVVGILIFLILAAFGLSIIAAEMGIVMTLLRYGGALYLIWMGIKLWTAEPVVPRLQPVKDKRGLFSVFATAIALNLGNPKMPLFYMALLPHVVGTTLTLEDALVIGGHVGLALRARTLLKSPRIVRRANRTAGGVMVGAGITVFATR